jgi:DNA topoisomerase-3
MKDCGLGTPATRAAIIETLLKRAYVVRTQQQLVPTALGIALIEALPVGSLASPELTGTWEARLARIARGEDSRAAFMADITRYVAETVDAIRGSSLPAPPAGLTGPASPAAVPRRTSTTREPKRAPRGQHRRNAARAPRRPPPAPRPPRPPTPPTPPPELGCPRCHQGTLITGARGWGCSRWRDGCRFVVWFETAGRRLSAVQLRDLITRGKTRKARFVSDRGIELDGRLVLDPAADGGSAHFEPA